MPTNNKQKTHKTQQTQQQPDYEDYIIGRVHENHTLPLVRQLYNDQLYLNPNKYGLFDYITKDNSTFVELKFRRNRHNAFNSLYVSSAKWVAGIEHQRVGGARVVIIWKCTDGFFAYEFNGSEVESSLVPKYIQRKSRTEKETPSNTISVPCEWMHKISPLQWGGGKYEVNFD